MIFNTQFKGVKVPRHFLHSGWKPVEVYTLPVINIISSIRRYSFFKTKLWSANQILSFVSGILLGSVVQIKGYTVKRLPRVVVLSEPHETRLLESRSDTDDGHSSFFRMNCCRSITKLLFTLLSKSAEPLHREGSCEENNQTCLGPSSVSASVTSPSYLPASYHGFLG